MQDYPGDGGLGMSEVFHGEKMLLEHQQTDLFAPQVLQFPHPLSRSAQPVQPSQLHTLLAILLLVSGQHVLSCQQLSQSLQSRQHGCGIDFDTSTKLA